MHTDHVSHTSLESLINSFKPKSGIRQFADDDCFERTEKGLAEIKKRGHTLTQSERQVLIWIASSLGGHVQLLNILAMSTVIKRERIERALCKLLEQDFIIEVLVELEQFAAAPITNEILTPEEIANYLETDTDDPNTVVLTDAMSDAMEEALRRIKESTNKVHDSASAQDQTQQTLDQSFNSSTQHDIEFAAALAQLRKQSGKKYLSDHIGNSTPTLSPPPAVQDIQGLPQIKSEKEQQTMQLAQQTEPSKRIFFLGIFCGFIGGASLATLLVVHHFQ